MYLDWFCERFLLLKNDIGFGFIKHSLSSADACVLFCHFNLFLQTHFHNTKQPFVYITNLSGAPRWCVAAGQQGQVA